MPSDISSVGLAGRLPGCDSTSRKNVLGRVEVPVVPGAAGRASPCPGRQVEPVEQVPAVRAGLRGRVPAVDHSEGASGAFGLVFEHAPKLAPCRVTDRFGEPAVFHHVRNREVFDGDQVVVADDPGGGLVEEVGAGVADLAMRGGDFGLGFAPVGRALLAVRHAPLVAGEIAGLALQMSQIGDALPIARDREVLDAQIDADLAAGHRLGVRIGGFDGEGPEPAAVRVAGDDDRGRVESGEVDLAEGPHECQWRRGLRQAQLAFAHAKRRARVVRGLARIAILESRVLGPSSEEVREGAVLVAQDLLQRHAGDLVQEGEVLGLLPSGQCRIGFAVGGAFAVRMPGVVALGQRLVPHQPHTAERAGQHARLFVVRVSPALVRRSHTLCLTERTFMCKPWGRCSTRFTRRSEGRGVPQGIA